MRFVEPASVGEPWRVDGGSKPQRAASQVRVSNGFTLIELLVVMAILAILFGLVVLSVPGIRERMRRTQCTSRLRQIGIAVRSYETSREHYPMGARGDGTFGTSWWVELLPHLDQQAVYDKYDRKSPHSGYVLTHFQNGMTVNRLTIETMICPSSSISALDDVGGFELMMSSYVGIAGATSHDGFDESRVTACCHPDDDGELSAGGMLVANAEIKDAHVLDGASHTLLASEASDYVSNANGAPRRVDASFPHGWIIGTRSEGTPPDYGDSLKSRCWNITSIRYAINTRDYSLPGIADNHGPNNPLLSAHGNGVNGLFVDGSVRFLNDDLDLTTLKRLATRDDRETVTLPKN